MGDRRGSHRSADRIRPQEITGSVRRERIEVQTEGDLADDEAG
jgi:hypothetical protein